MNSPCYQCEKRQEGCHDSCADYQEYRQIMIDINRRRKRELHYDYMVTARQQRAKKEPSRIETKNGGYRKRDERMQDIKKYMAERDEVFRSLDWEKIRRFCLKWQIPIPKKNITFKAGVYKTILHMYSSTDKEKAVAIEWLTNHGFNLDL